MMDGCFEVQYVMDRDDGKGEGYYQLGNIELL